MNARRGLALLLFFAHGAIACGKKYVDPQEEARKRDCPELPTWAACDEKIRAENATKKEAALTRANGQIAAALKNYDAKPKPDKQALKAIMAQSGELAKGLQPEPLQQQFVDTQAAEFRKRMAPLFTPESFSEGPPDWKTLVPSKNPAQCGIWASMWTNDDETLDSLATLGFRYLQCGEKSWSVELLSRVCWLYERANPKGSVFVWNDVPAAKTGTQLGKQTGDEAALRMLAFVSAHAQIVQVGGRFEIVDRYEGFIRVEGREAQKGVDGFVSPTACHRAPLKR